VSHAFLDAQHPKNVTLYYASFNRQVGAEGQPRHLGHARSRKHT
jgi:hypothetical protein